jgi:hypothetical protein
LAVEGTGMRLYRSITVGKLKLLVTITTVDGETHSALSDDKQIRDVVENGLTNAAKEIGDELLLSLKV